MRLLILAVCLAAGLAAQTTSTIKGRVYDVTGGILDGAKVTARQVDTGFERAAAALSDGSYVLTELPAGRYELRAEQAGFRPLLLKGILLTVAETSVVDLTLEVGSLDQEVTITSDAPPINTSTAELSYLVGSRTIQDLPLNGRNYTDLALLQPGVVAFPQRDGGSVVAHGLGTSVNGQDPRSNVYLLDGTPLNDFTNGPAGSAAGTSLGMETIREFRVETNAYSAEFGRNSGGQINVLTKSGTNTLHGSLYEYFRNDHFDARNFFDSVAKPKFTRNQFGGSLGGPIVKDKSFYFVGWESLHERLGKTIASFVPDDAARAGAVAANVRPYLNEIPRANGPEIGGGLATFIWGARQPLSENYVQGRYDRNIGSRQQLFARYTYDDTQQDLPTDFPQFPRSYLSTNQFFTLEHHAILSPSTLNTMRAGFSRTRIGQNVRADTSQSLAPFAPGNTIIGDIDIGGMPRFGPQSSGNLRLVQNVYGFEEGLSLVRGSHLFKLGGLIEHYQDNMFNPTFGNGIFTFSGLGDFLRGAPARFVGLSPGGALDRYWRFTLFAVYAQDTLKLTSRLTVNYGLRYETTTTPVDIYGRDSALISFSDHAPTVGQLYQNPTRKNLSPRVGLAWDPFGSGRTSVRAGYGWYFNTNNQQNLIVTVTNPPATPRAVIASPTFPSPPFNAAATNTIRPVQWDLRNPNVHVWNASIQHTLWADTVITLGYAGSRGVHLLRSGDINAAVPARLADGTYFYSATAPRPNSAFTTIEAKTSDGNSWYESGILEIRKRLAKGFIAQSSYTFARSIDTTQASTFFSDAINDTTSAMPELPGFHYNKGLSDFQAKHNWVMNLTYQFPGGGNWAVKGWQVSAISNVRSGNPVTVFVQNNRSRSKWAPSLGPGIGSDRPSIAPGFTYESAVLGRPDQWFNPAAFVLQPAGQLGTEGRNALIGPNLRTGDFSLSKNTPLTRLNERAALQFRVEAFNLFNRANLELAPPALLAFAGSADNENPLSTLGRARATLTSSRQIQLGLRISF
jgi:hypothetical protein